MTDTTEPFKLLLCQVSTIIVLRFASQEAADAADDFFTSLGWHTLIIHDVPSKEAQDAEQTP